MQFEMLLCETEENRKAEKAMKKQFRKIAMGILLVVFLVSTALTLRQIFDNVGGEASYADAQAIAMQRKEASASAETLPASDPAGEASRKWVPVPVEGDLQVEELEKINLAALREVNPDVVGWIRIPDTKINYPLMQGEDNEFYLNHTWEKDPNSVGSVFLEWQNSADLTDYNTIVYAHNMNTGAMFSDLELFALKAYWKERPYVYIATDDAVYRYEIFAFFQPEVESLTYGMNPQRNDTKEKFLNKALEKAWYDTGVRPAVTDRILTLSTCSGADYDFRYVVQARLPMMEVME